MRTGRHQVTRLRVVRSEWTKLRSVPSTGWSLLTAGVLIIGFGAGYSTIRVTRPPRQPAAGGGLDGFDPTAVSLAGVGLAQVAIGVLGVLLVTASWSDHSYEYLPVPAGLAVTAVRPDVDALSPWTGLGLFCVYTAALLATAAWRLRRRDA